MTHKLASNENFDIVRGNQTVRIPFDATDPSSQTIIVLATVSALANKLDAEASGLYRIYYGPNGLTVVVDFDTPDAKTFEFTRSGLPSTNATIARLGDFSADNTALADVIRTLAPDPRYTSETIVEESGAFSLKDRAINGVASSVTTATLVLPPAVSGKVRDFMVRLTLSASAALAFQASSGETVTWDDTGDPSGTYAAGTHLLSFTEVAPGVFHWGRPLDFTRQTFDFSTTQGVIDAVAALVSALGGSVINKPSAT